jgi:hypothetical protein
MLRIMRDPTCDHKRRDTMALKLAATIYKPKEAAPSDEKKVAIRKFSVPVEE